MKERKYQVLVSQPGKHHVHQLCLALQSRGWLQLFVTSVWYKPRSPGFRRIDVLPFSIRKRLVYVLKKRYHPLLDESRIQLYPWAELLRQLLIGLFKAYSERWVLYVERIHDHFVAGRLKEYQPQLVIGYEKASLKTFRAARQQGIITMLDLAQVHYTHIQYLRNQFPTFRSLMSDRLFNKINACKMQEYHFTDYVLTLSSYARHTLEAAGIPSEKIFTVNLGFDPVKFKPKTAYRSADKFQVLFVGTITQRKGIHLLLEAFRQLALPNAELVLIGPMADGKVVLDQYAGFYTYHPFLHHEELAEQYRQADLFVFPSYLDSWAMTVVEAMACGTPVVVSEHTGAKDAVCQGGGFVIPVDDVEAIKEKILYFYNDRTQLEEFGRKAHEVAQQYTWANYEQQIDAVIQQIMKDRGQK